MPRDGSGAADNAVEAGHNIVHGEPANQNEKPTASGVDRSNKAVPPPEGEEGAALDGMNASGGGAKPEGSGKGPIEGQSTVEKVAKSAS